MNKLKKDSETARNFVLRMEKAIDEIKEEEIKKILEKIQK